MEPINLNNKKKMKNALFIVFLVLILLIGRIGYIQFIQGGSLQVLAYEQQVQRRAVNSKRGTIYDATGKYILAVSSTAYTITANPTNISEKIKRLLLEK